jgi:hypothetical protein
MVAVAFCTTPNLPRQIIALGKERHDAADEDWSQTPHARTLRREPLRSLGTLPNFLMIVASPNSTVAGSPVGLNHGSHMCGLLRKGFGAHHDRSRLETFGWFTRSYAIAGGYEGQLHTISHSRHVRSWSE